ncbi:MAG: response regulator [Synergistaceae bacterium]|nr:response regulator [Synergistaceae bacterium]
MQAEMDLKSRIANLEDALAASEDESRKMAAFIANMSHEIRTPLNTIIGVVALFQDTKLDFEQKKFVEMLSASSSDLLQLVEELLDMSRLKTGGLELQESPVPVRSCFSQAVRPLAMAARERRVQVELTIPPSVPEFLLGDSHRLRQTLRNIVATAIALTARGAILINVVPEEETNESVMLHVTIEHPSNRASNDRIRAMLDHSALDRTEFSQAYEGTGIGLIISEGIAEAAGGALWAESLEDERNVFHLTLNLKKIPSPASQSPENLPKTQEENLDPAQLPAELSILVVDDNNFNRSLTRSILRKKGGPGWTIDLAKGGEEALRMVAEKEFDLVFMDIQMPGMNGLDTTREIRAREGADTRLPVVAMTAYAMEGDRQMCLDAGMNDYIAKPVDPDELVEIILRNTAPG